MKKNFYKEYQKKQKLASNYEETDKIIVENQNTLLKILSYLIALIHSIFKLLLFLGIIILLSVGATIICNKSLQINLLNIIGGNLWIKNYYYLWYLF